MQPAAPKPLTRLAPRALQAAAADGRDAALPEPGLIQLPGLCGRGRVLHAARARHHARAGLEHVQLARRRRCVGPPPAALRSALTRGPAALPWRKAAPRGALCGPWPCDLWQLGQRLCASWRAPFAAAKHLHDAFLRHSAAASEPAHLRQ